MVTGALVVLSGFIWHQYAWLRQPRLLALKSEKWSRGGDISLSPIFVGRKSVFLDVTVFGEDGVLIDRLSVGTINGVLANKGVKVGRQATISLITDDYKNGDYTVVVRAPRSLRKKIQIKKTVVGMVVPERVYLLYGDTNNDGVIDSLDTNFIKSVLGATERASDDWYSSGRNLRGAEDADIDNDGLISNSDVQIAAKNLGSRGD
ncbi:hypothetical protein EON80_11430 [bacterium]|nr:MAG: hypothetical protein EON80_11430 [bacterium]